MNFSDLRNGLRDNLLTVCDNVTETFVHPEAMAELQGEFPYITFVFGEGTIEGRRVEQSVSIIGFVEGDTETIPDLLIELKNNIYNALYNKEPKIVIESQNLTNLFSPFGLDAGVGPPFGGVRFECVVPGIINNL
jgi:hypothetical protein